MRLFEFVSSDKALDVETPSIEQVAEKYDVSVTEVLAQLKTGVKVESEHTTDFNEAMKIALDHINENLNYYDHLKFIESSLNELDIPPAIDKLLYKKEYVAALNELEKYIKELKANGEFDKTTAFYAARIASRYRHINGRTLYDLFAKKHGTDESAGATSAGAVASVANPVTKKQKKNKDGTVKNATDEPSLFSGNIAKR